MRNYLKFLFVYTLVFSIPFIAIFVVFFYFKEFYSFNHILENQLDKKEKNILYGSGIESNAFSMKSKLIDLVDSDLYIVGSSRALQMRQQHFLYNGSNIGGAIRNVKDVNYFIDKIITKKPKIIVLTIDFWWFNKKYNDKLYSKLNKLNVIKDRKSPQWKDIWVFLSYFKKDFNPITNFFKLQVNKNNYGVLGHYGEGYDFFGSYYNGLIINGLSRSKDENFKLSLANLKNGKEHFSFGKEFDLNAMKDFLQTLKKIKNNKIPLIILMPPIAPVLYQKIKNNENYRFSYIQKFKSYLKKSGYNVFDYTFLKGVTDNSCEYIDGTHAGEIINNRILKDLYFKDKAKLKNLIDLNAIDKNIKNYSGFALAGSNSYWIKEIDFLQIGCKKIVQ